MNLDLIWSRYSGKPSTRADLVTEPGMGQDLSMWEKAGHLELKHADGKGVTYMSHSQGGLEWSMPKEKGRNGARWW